MNQKNTSISIFIVEDQELYSLALDYKLKQLSANYHFSIFSTAEDCVNNLNLNPHIIILDYYLPGMNGMEALKKIKAYDPGIAVIILSMQQDVQLAVDTIEAGAYDYVVKNKDAISRISKDINNITAKINSKDDNFSLGLKVNKYKILLIILILLSLGMLISVISMLK